MSSLPRRDFIRLAGAGIAWAGLSPAARAIGPIQRPAPPRLQLGLAAYSFRDYFRDSTHPQNKAVEHRLDMPQFLDYCAAQGCAGAELTSYYFPKDVTDDALRDIRRHAFLRGVAISGTSVGNNFGFAPGPDRDREIALVKLWIDRAAVLGAPHIRVFAGTAKGIPPEEARKHCIAALEECCQHAGSKGIFLGIENHGGIVAEPEHLLEIVRAVQSPWLGINLDTGNFHTPDPYAALTLCAPYAVNVQMKSEIKPAGAKEKQPADLKRLTGILRQAGYQGFVTLEYEAAEDPWKAVPPLLNQMKELFAAAPAAGGEAGWTPLFDGTTLSGWKPTGFGGAGEVSVADGQIILDAGNDLTGITLASEPPRMNYELSLEAQRLQGSDFFCALTVPVGEAFVTYVVGGWGGAVVGISSINGDDASENESTQFKKFVDRQWYRIRLKVTPDSLETWLDDEQMAKVALAGKTLSMRAGEIELSQPLGIASFRTRAALRDIKLRKL